MGSESSRASTMVASHELDDHDDAPSIQERIMALHHHERLFDTIAKYSQVGIYERFEKQWAFVIADMEADIHEYWRAVTAFVRENARPGEEVKKDEVLRENRRKVVSKLRAGLFVHHNAVKASSDMSSFPTPSVTSMETYRTTSRFDKDFERAANGEKLSMYGEKNGPIPSNLFTVHDEDLEPMAEFLVKWILNPFVNHIGVYLERFWFSLPISGHRRSNNSVYMQDVSSTAVSAVAKVLVCTIAILSLVVPIATLYFVEESKLRFIVMTLFGHAFAGFAQFMGPRAIPMYSLITAYFQTMVFFFGATSPQTVRSD